MKREEFLNLLEEELHSCNSCYNKSKKETAERLLKLIEQYMEPPELPGVFHDGRMLKRGWEK